MQRGGVPVIFLEDIGSSSVFSSTESPLGCLSQVGSQIFSRGTWEQFLSYNPYEI